MGITHYKRVAEVSSESGLPHSHWLCWSSSSPSTLLASLQKEDDSLTKEDLQPVVNFGKATITASMTANDLKQQFPSLSEQDVEEVVTLARKWQVHRCTPHCTTSYPPGQECSQFYPQLPSLLPLQSRRPSLVSEANKIGFMGFRKLHERIQSLLRQHPHPGVLGDDSEVDPVVALLALLRQLGPGPHFLDSGSYEWAGMMIRHTDELETLLEEVLELRPETVGDQMLLGLYHQTLLYRRHAKYLPVRRVSEAMVVQYSPELLLAAQANIDVSLVTHTVHRLVDYMSKGATTQTTTRMAEQLDSWGSNDGSNLAEELRAAVEEGDYREVSLTEALYMIFPELHHSCGNVFVEWVGIDPPDSAVVIYSLRLVILISYTLKHCTGLFRPESLACVTLLQWLAWYRLAKKGREDEAIQEGLAIPVITPGDFPAPPGHTSLPQVARLLDGRVMRRRRKPVAINWGASGDFEDIMMMKVGSCGYHLKCVTFTPVPGLEEPGAGHAAFQTASCSQGRGGGGGHNQQGGRH